MTLTINPFICGRAVKQSEFLGRETELRQLFSRLATGQSTALVGLPHTGKTSLLTYLKDERMRTNFCGNLFIRDVFSYIDVHALGDPHTQTDFWRRSFKPLAESLKVGELQHIPLLQELYDYAENNNFGTFVLENLFEAMSSAGSRLILLIDEFDSFLSSSVLNSGEFYGSLRSLASRTGGLVLVIASRLNLNQLNQQTQDVYGSPYFNIFIELHLGPFTDKDLIHLLERSNERFDSSDHNYISKASGYHPYLAQAAASTLWDVCEQNILGLPRYITAGEALQRQARSHFASTWRSWTNETRKAMTAVALTQIPRLLEDRTFKVSRLTMDLNDYYPELKVLVDSGMLTQNEKGEWSVTQGAFLWWLADELRRNVRDQTEFNIWLQAQEIDGLFTNEKKQYLGQAVGSCLTTMKQGTPILIEAFIKNVT